MLPKVCFHSMCVPPKENLLYILFLWASQNLQKLEDYITFFFNLRQSFFCDLKKFLIANNNGYIFCVFIILRCYIVIVKKAQVRSLPKLPYIWYHLHVYIHYCLNGQNSLKDITNIKI